MRETDDDLFQELRARGLDPSAHVAVWMDLAELLAAFDAIGRDGSNALLKTDGERENGKVYTVVLSGGKLPKGDFYRKDSDDLRLLLREAIAYYLAAT